MSPEQKKAVTKATNDFKKGNKPIIVHPESAVRKTYFDTYYTIRTETNLSHIIEKYGPIK
jgi:hypothetical protein